MKSHFILAACLTLSFSLSAHAGETATQKTATQKTATQKTATQKTATQKTATQKTAKKSKWQTIAERRAATMAARNYRGHLPGVPVGIFEGVGFGGWNCATCVGSGTLLGDAQAKGSDGTVYRVRLWTGGQVRRITRYRLVRRTRAHRRN